MTTRTRRRGDTRIRWPKAERDYVNKSGKFSPSGGNSSPKKGDVFTGLKDTTTEYDRSAFSKAAVEKFFGVLLPPPACLFICFIVCLCVGLISDGKFSRSQWLPQLTAVQRQVTRRSSMHGLFYARVRLPRQQRLTGSCALRHSLRHSAIALLRVKRARERQLW